ncbi:MAG: DUF89 family protein, partial [Spirochaetes bacterium]|nr:DUF89 family protein [Spirochaetota bacterium]
MRTYLDCIPCFFRQALEAARLADADTKTQKKILDKLAKMIPGFSMRSTPPEMGMVIHRIIKEMTGNRDPYRKIKAKSNRSALSYYPRLKKKISHSSDKLRCAVEIAIAGNIIDYGVKNSLNIEEELKKILDTEKKAVPNESRRLFNFPSFSKSIKKAVTILYLGDNAGEIVFDRILIEEIKKNDKRKKIIFAVRDEPIINDVLMED